jgi:hypothetical protein
MMASSSAMLRARDDMLLCINSSTKDYESNNNTRTGTLEGRSLSSFLLELWAFGPHSNITV